MQRGRGQGRRHGGPLNLGSVPLLELIGTCDPFIPQAYWGEVRSQFGARLSTLVIEDASHALFPAQPDRVAAAELL